MTQERPGLSGYENNVQNPHTMQGQVNRVIKEFIQSAW